MKEKIYTIPINDAFSQNSECPLCAFLQKEESDRIEYALGASMMEPDARILSNENGYCNRHCQMMYDYGNKLSHALVLETRLDYLIESLNKAQKDIVSYAPKKVCIGKSRLKECIKSNGEFYRRQKDKCIICQRLEKVLKAFTENLFYLYRTDSEFAQKIKDSRGFCIEHFGYLLANSADNLNENDCFEFCNMLMDVEQKQLCELKEDVSWFSKKFDYRYKDADWKNSKDAVKRGCEKTSSFIKNGE